MTTNHGYSFSVLQGDYFRAFVGLIICLAPYILGAEIVGAVSILLGCAALFAVSTVLAPCFNSVSLFQQHQKLPEMSCEI